MTVFHTLRDTLGRPVSLGKEVVKDEQNALYLVTRREGTLAKVWFDPLETPLAARLEAAVRVRGSALEEFCAWPTSLLQDQQGTTVGFLMAQVNTADFRPIPEVYPAQAPRYPRTWAFRAQAGSRVAQAVAALHAAGQVIGNVTERNILVSPGGQVRLIGADSYQVSEQAGLGGPQVYAGRPSLLDLTPPELQAGGVAARIRTPQHDLFGLAVVLFRLLFDGRHPYSGVPVGRPMPSPGEAIAQGAFAYAAQPKPFVRRPPATPGLDVLPPQLAAMFERAFADGAPGQTVERPSAHDWQQALALLAQEMEPCPDNPDHQRVRGRPCPVCEAEKSRIVPVAQPKADLSGAVGRMWAQVQAVNPPDKPAVLPPEVAAPRLPPLPLHLPAPPRTLIKPETQENILRWGLRLLVLGAIIAVVYLIQKSVLAAVVEVGLVVAALTLGRRFSVDWDGMIDNFQNAEGRFVERLTPTQGQWQAYHTALLKRRDDIRQKFAELRDEYKTLEDRYARQHAHALYTAQLAQLDTLRRALTQEDGAKAGGPQAGTGGFTGSVQGLLDAQAAEALAEYLRRQTIAPNVIPGLSARMALNLTNMGLRRASDIQGDKLKAVRPDLAENLTQWRSNLAAFFQFDPASVSTQQLELAQQREQQQKASDFRRFSQDVTRFTQTDWAEQEDALLVRMREVKGQAKQYQNALKELDKLVG